MLPVHIRRLLGRLNECLYKGFVSRNLFPVWTAYLPNLWEGWEAVKILNLDLYSVPLKLTETSGDTTKNNFMPILKRPIYPAYFKCYRNYKPM